MKLRLIILFIIFCANINIVNAQTEAVTPENYIEHYSNGNVKYMVGDYEAALPELITAAEIYNQLYDVEKDVNYQELSFKILDCAHHTENYKLALPFANELVAITKNINGSKHQDYAKVLGILAAFYGKSGNHTDAIKLCIEASAILKEEFGTDNEDYISLLDILVTNYYKIADFKNAINVAKESMDLSKRVFGTNHASYAINLANLASCYYKIGKYNEAIMLATEAKEIRKRILGIRHPDYSESLNNLATYYAAIGDYVQAINFGEEAVKIYKNNFGSKQSSYATSLNNLAHYYLDLGNINKALQLQTEALNIRKEIYGVEHPDYATSLSNLASCYAELHNYNEAIRLTREAIEITKTLGDTNLEYATYLNNLSHYYSKMDDNEKALKFGMKSMEIRKNTLGPQHPEYAISLDNLSSYYSKLGNEGEAIRLISEVIKICKTSLGKDHPYYAQCLDELASYYSDSENYNEAIKYSKEAMQTMKKHVLSIFSGISETERAIFWNRKAYLYNYAYPHLFYLANDLSQWGVIYDNCALFAKGLLLNAEMEMRKVIQESGDPNALAKYDELRSNQVMLNRQLEKPIAERQMDCDSLRILIEQEERELARMSTAFGDFTRNLRLTWQDVQRNLQDDDIAVEFLSFPMENSDSVMYIALTLRKNDTLPRMVTMFEQKQLKMDDRAAFTADPAMTEVVWGPLSEALKGVKNIYFAPSGELHRLGIEYLPGMEAYNIYRLSSTRELVNRNHERGNGAVLYGDINYNTSLKTLAEKAQTTKSDETMFAYNSVPALRGGNSLRGEVGHLTGSKREVEAIHKLLPSSTLLEYNDATEESFKALSGKRVAIIHLSTHGRYYTPDATDLNHKASFIRMGDDSRSVEDKALTRSCLMMAGANNVLGDDPETVDGVDDGVLTAKEIAQVDLRGCDLAVLSACETALGDLGSGEGVFGLQRGFKKAGVQTLLMSLWPVDDTATEILMTEFYRQLVAGKSKRDAFQSAQHHLRTTDGGKWNSPQYWASFILLD